MAVEVESKVGNRSNIEPHTISILELVVLDSIDSKLGFPGLQ
jgi:hypothetical protein